MPTRLFCERQPENHFSVFRLPFCPRRGSQMENSPVNSNSLISLRRCLVAGVTMATNIASRTRRCTELRIR